MNSLTEFKHKVIIVGGGPAGITAAIYAGRANLNPLVISGENEGSLIPGGQLMLTTEVENFPGFPEGIDGPTLMERMTAQASRFGATIIQHWATDFDLPPGGPFRVLVGDEWITTQSVIFANGASAKWLDLPLEEQFRNHGISACATCDGPLPCFRNQPIHVVGGGDSAIEEATFLSRFASKVTIIHRRDELRASKIMQQRAKDNPKIDFLYNSKIVAYEGEESLERLVIQDTVTNEKKTIPTKGLFMAIGHDPLTKHLKNKLNLTPMGYIQVKSHIETEIEGVFAAGDVHDHHFKQAISAAGFGCMAAISAERWIEARGMNK